MKKPELICPWRLSTKWWSQRLMALALVFEFLQLLVPVWQDIIPRDISVWMTAICITVAMVARNIRQNIDDSN